MSHIQILADRIQAARDAYYNKHPIMSDAEYDALEDELRQLDPSHALLAQVGAPVGGAWPKVKHHIPMGSLNKAQVEADMKDWHQGCGSNPPALAVMDNLDGASIALVYRNRALVQAITRGDGSTGEDITRNVKLMKGALKMLPPVMNGSPTPTEVHVRGEIVCLRSDFETHFKGESNPRNTAAGTAKRQSGHEKCAYLTVIAYQCMPNGVGMDTKALELRTLQDMGFRTPRWELVASMGEVLATYQDYITRTRQSLNYDIDGLVIEVDDLHRRESLGELNGRPKGAIAFKFPHEVKPTALIDVEWQVGNSGRLTPVAIFAPVNLGGRLVERASLATVRQVEHLKLYKGCTIMVSLRNDVIPRVESNLSEGVEND